MEIIKIKKGISANEILEKYFNDFHLYSLFSEKGDENGFSKTIFSFRKGTKHIEICFFGIGLFDRFGRIKSTENIFSVLDSNEEFSIKSDFDLKIDQNLIQDCLGPVIPASELLEYY